MAKLELGVVGPAQSDDLYHFTGRNGSRPTWVPEDIQRMTPQERLECILKEERLRAFAPFGTTRACVCFSESPPDHLEHLISMGRFSPWGVVSGRAGLLGLGGGAVAYVPDDVFDRFKARGLEHWAVRTGSDSAWMHEREWRLPLTKDAVRISSVRAILVGDPNWRPSPVETGEWIDRSTGEPAPGPDGSPRVEQVKGLPRLWRESAIWVWDAGSGAVVKHPPGALC
ncbi:hypothetical protein [Streptomyces javensis]|uniref:Uncharacterized protein n=1 Tax=Streptomyces javensis TaxID=114698 RepID=A0ABS0R2L7_9ACTN|nr:hypothetical protein [Streptomyces javensis]MBI0311612.1 hypothetical protein [Streptomyces javensis]